MEARNDELQNQYLAENKVGEGTYAVVFVGRKKSSGAKIAIKQIKRSAFKDGIDMSAIREIKFLQELNHTNVIQLLDVYSTPSNISLVLEFLPSDLEMLIRDHSVVFSAGDIKSWMLMLLRGLHHCHRNFVLHRDLKPNNLLLSPDGKLKIADFGLARSVNSPRDKLTPTVVTRWYKAPELLFGARHYTTAIDVWSVGAIFAELMLRIPYLPGQTDAAQADITFQALGTPTEKIWPGVESLPGYKSVDFKFYPVPSRQELQMRFTAATDSALDLMDSMLHLNPLNRCDTEAALLSPYFREEPLATKPENLPRKT